MAAASELAEDALPSSPGSDPVPSEPFDWHPLVEPDLWDRVPADVPALLPLLPKADLSVQDEVDIRLHPTLTRCWSRQGHHGQRLVRAPGQNSKVVGFAAADWRNGWLSHGSAWGRTATAYCHQLDHLLTRSKERGRSVIVGADNWGIHTPRGSKKLRDTLASPGDDLRLVFTPAYDPEANPTERFWQPFRHSVTHNHRRDRLIDLVSDAAGYFVGLDHDPTAVLRHLGSPFAYLKQATA